MSQNAETACVDSVLLQSCEHTLPFILNGFCLFVCLILRQGLPELPSLALNFCLSQSGKWNYRPVPPAQQHIFRH